MSIKEKGIGFLISKIEAYHYSTFLKWYKYHQEWYLSIFKNYKLDFQWIHYKWKVSTCLMNVIMINNLIMVFNFFISFT